MKIDSVMVIGCGGLGGFVIEELSRLGIKNLVLIDGDEFSISNMNRQLESGLDTLGKNKALVYKDRLERKGETKVTAITEFFSDKNANILKDVDVVMDCVDSINARLLIAKECTKYGKIIIHGGIEGSFGQACVCYPEYNAISKLYESKEEQVHSTNVYSVATIASLQVALLNKLREGHEDEIKNKLFIVDMDSFSIETIRI